MRKITVIWKFKREDEVFIDTVNRGINFDPEFDGKKVMLSVLREYSKEFFVGPCDTWANAAYKNNVQLLAMLEGEVERAYDKGA